MPDFRLVIPVAALWLCCGLGVGVTEVMPVTALVAAILAVASLVSAANCAGARARGAIRFARRSGGSQCASGSPRRVLAMTTIVMAAIGLGAVTIVAQTPGRTDAVLSDAVEQRARVTAAIRIESAPRRWGTAFDGSEQWRLRGTTVEIGGAGHDADRSEEARREASIEVGAGVPVSVVVPGDVHSVRDYVLGSIIAASVSAQLNAPGEATTFTLRSATAPTLSERSPPWLAWTAPVRDTFTTAASHTPGDGGDLLPGLAIGDETAVTPELDEAMKTSSLSHLTAVSGANCALVTGLVFFLARSLGLGRRARIVAAVGALAIFVALVGPGASVLRAATMALVVLVGLARGRTTDGLPSLALAVGILLVHDPWLARDYGFALSVLATAGLLLLARPIAVVFSRWLPRGIALALAVPVAAQLACQPVLILLNPALPLFGVLSNLVTEPAAPLATLLGCLSCLVLPWAPVLGQAFVWLAWLPSAWIAIVARFAEQLPGAVLPWPDGFLGVALCVLVLLAVAVIAAGSRVSRAVASAAAFTLVGGCLVYTGVLGGGSLGSALSKPGEWMIAACDVGQGDALVLRDSGHVALIDVGRRQQHVAACLDQLGIGRLDWVLLTHFDADHAGGIEAVLDRTSRVIVGEPGRDSDHALLERMKATGIDVESGRSGRSGSLGSIEWRIVWPPEPTVGQSRLSGNAGSLVVHTQAGGLSALFLGDLGEHEQEALNRVASRAGVDVVKVAHHGSADQSEQLYRDLHARLGLISVGDNNGYGHPAQRALDVLARSGTAVARTDQGGLLLVTPTAEGPGLWAEHAETLGADGRAYSGNEQGGPWRHEAARPVHADVEYLRRRRARFRNWSGTRSARRRWCSSLVPRAFSRIARCGCYATSSPGKTRALRSATSQHPITRGASFLRSRAPPYSASPG